jgi:hypothetical protein
MILPEKAVLCVIVTPRRQVDASYERRHSPLLGIPVGSVHNHGFLHRAGRLRLSTSVEVESRTLQLHCQENDCPAGSPDGG